MNSKRDRAVGDDVAHRVEAVVPGHVGDGEAVVVEHGDESGRATLRRHVDRAVLARRREHDERSVRDEVAAVAVEVVDFLVERTLLRLSVDAPETGHRVDNGLVSLRLVGLRLDSHRAPPVGWHEVWPVSPRPVDEVPAPLAQSRVLLGSGVAEAHGQQIEAGAHEDGLTLVPAGPERPLIVAHHPPVRAVPVALRVDRTEAAAMIDPAFGQQPPTVPDAITQVQQPEAGEVARRGMEE